MELGFLLTISCVMTTVAMMIFVGIIIFFLRFGGQGVQMLFDRFTGGGDDQKEANPQYAGQSAQQQSAVASSQSLRQRARQLDFPAPSGAAGGAFAAQAAAGNNYPDFPPPQNNAYGQQQASLTPRGQVPDFNPQVNQGGQAGGFQPSTPSLSPSRPFSAGSQSAPNQRPQQGNLGQPQQPLRPNQGQFGQQQQQGNSGNPQQGQFGQQQQGNFSQPQQGQFGQQQQGNFGQPQQGQFGQQQQGNLGQPQQPLRPNQGQFGQQQQQGNSGNPNQPQQGGLGQKRPPLRSRPRPGNTQYDAPIGGRDRRKGDDRDYIYDDRGNNGGNNFVDDVGDFIDNF